MKLAVDKLALYLYFVCAQDREEASHEARDPVEVVHAAAVVDLQLRMQGATDTLEA